MPARPTYRRTEIWPWGPRPAGGSIPWEPRSSGIRTTRQPIRRRTRRRSPAPSNPKGGDIGEKADNFFLRVNNANNISSIDGIHFQETLFETPADTFFLFERGGNDTGTWQAIHADRSPAGPLVSFIRGDQGGPYANTGVNVGGQNAWGVAFTTDTPVAGVRISASGHDTLSISTPVLFDELTWDGLSDGSLG